MTRFSDPRADLGDLLRRGKIADGRVLVYCPRHRILLSTRLEAVTHGNRREFRYERDAVTGWLAHVRWEPDGQGCPRCEEERR